jgi:hypothetical protein
MRSCFEIRLCSINDKLSKEIEGGDEEYLDVREEKEK